MKDARLSAGEGNRWSLSGDLVFADAARVLREGEAAFGGAAQAEVDLAGVGRVDSAGLALLLEWSLAARDQGRRLDYRNVPGALSALAGIGDVSGLLGFPGDSAGGSAGAAPGGSAGG